MCSVRLGRPGGANSLLPRIPSWVLGKLLVDRMGQAATVSWRSWVETLLMFAALYLSLPADAQAFELAGPVQLPRFHCTGNG